MFVAPSGNFTFHPACQKPPVPESRPALLLRRWVRSVPGPDDKGSAVRKCEHWGVTLESTSAVSPLCSPFFVCPGLVGDVCSVGRLGGKSGGTSSISSSTSKSGLCACSEPWAGQVSWTSHPTYKARLYSLVFGWVWVNRASGVLFCLNQGRAFSEHLPGPLAGSLSASFLESTKCIWRAAHIRVAAPRAMIMQEVLFQGDGDNAEKDRSKTGAAWKALNETTRSWNIACWCSFFSMVSLRLGHGSIPALYTLFGKS